MPEEADDGFRLYGTNHSLRSAGDKMSSILATVLILTPVVVLHFLNNASYRLVVVVVSSLAFTTAMVTLTEAKRSEIFAAAAAFIAVQVVYLGAAIDNHGSAHDTT